MNLNRSHTFTFLPAMAFAIAIAASFGSIGAAQQAEPEPGVGNLKRAVIIEFHEAITPLSGAILKRRFEEAQAAGAEIIVLDIDSPGGYVSTTLELVDMLEQAKGVTSVAYIQREAISGAALLSLAANKIVIGKTALIGDAGMIMMGEDAAFRYVPEKERSYLAQRVRTIAEKAGRPPSLAEAMVDKDLEVFKAVNKADGTVAYFSEREWKSMEDIDKWEKGLPVREAGGSTFFTAKGSRAVELGVADFSIDNPADLAAAIGAISPIPIIQASVVDKLIVVLNSPFITGLLLVVGLVALVVEFGSPGIGLGGLTSILCFGLFFWSRFLGGTSGWFEVMLFAIGLAFVMLEIFVIPGIGVAGIGGGGLMMFALFIASRRFILPESSRDLTAWTVDVLTILAAVIGFFIASSILVNFLTGIPILKRLALVPGSDDSASIDTMLAVASPDGSGGLEPATISLGQEGVADGPLRPSGRIRIDDQLIDVITEGDFIDNGSRVKVISKRGNRIVVRAV